MYILKSLIFFSSSISTSRRSQLAEIFISPSLGLKSAHMFSEWYEPSFKSEVPVKLSDSVTVSGAQDRFLGVFLLFFSFWCLFELKNWRNRSLHWWNLSIYITNFNITNCEVKFTSLGRFSIIVKESLPSFWRNWEIHLTHYSLTTGSLGNVNNCIPDLLRSLSRVEFLPNGIQQSLHCQLHQVH